jgi:hypothetical protein
MAAVGGLQTKLFFAAPDIPGADVADGFAVVKTTYVF